MIDCDCEWARDGISGFAFFVIMHLGASAVYHASISACVSELTRSKAPEDGPRSELSSKYLNLMVGGADEVQVQAQEALRAGPERRRSKRSRVP